MEFGLLIIICAAVIFTLIGLIYTNRKKISLTEYVGKNNSLGLGALISTLFASGMGAWILFGPAETTITSGIIGIIGYALGSLLSLWMFIIIGTRVRNMMPKGHTLIEFVLHRFGKGMYILILVISVFYMMIALTAELTGIALAGDLVFNIPLSITASVVGLGVLIYTATGGFRASVFTDKVQTWVIVPLFALVVIGTIIYLDGLGVISTTSKKFPELFGLSKVGLEFGITLIIAIVGAEFFNQGWWQRVYASKSNSTTKKGFFVAGILVFPIILIAGFFGYFALGTDAAATPSVAMFSFLLGNTPSWMIILTMVLAVALVMSSLDTLLNGIVSIFTVDFVRIKKNANQGKVLSFSKWFTVVLAGIAILIAAKGFSVLYLFLIADLVCVGALLPVLFGMYSSKYSGSQGLIGSILGIVCGLLWFPTPSWSTSVFGIILTKVGVTIPPIISGNLLWSFIVALLVPIVTVFFCGTNKFKFKTLLKKGADLKTE